ncbi:MAG: M14 family metallopeptidase [Roseiflexaceae bacterium]
MRSMVHLGVLLCILLFGGATSVAWSQSVQVVEIGQSYEGRPIVAYRFGGGPHKLVVVGATHGGAERNTQVLSMQLIDWFRNHPEDVPQDVELIIIPLLNPDGDALDVRQNARGVDLNRNMNSNLDACPENDWSESVFGAYGTQSNTGGKYADSEPESRVIRSFLLDASGVIFLHSAAGLVFPAQCQDAIAIQMAEVYAKAANYKYARFWDLYPITGGMHDWARGIELPAIIPELITGDEPEFAQNLAGVIAIMRQAEQLLPPIADRQEGDVRFIMPIWRFWQAYGIDKVGQPLGTYIVENGVYTQHFAHMSVQYDATSWHANVQPLALDLPELDGEIVDIIDERTVITFTQSRFIVHDAFAEYYTRIDGERMLGWPTSPEYRIIQGDTPMYVQQFLYGSIAFDEQRNAFIHQPVVWQSMVQSDLVSNRQPLQLR